jgi:uncharacterized protein (TIGR02246 family)
VAGGSSVAVAADEAARQREEQAIRAAARQYIEALAKGDAKTMHAMWTADGDIVDESGRAMPAHDVIDREAKAREQRSGGNPGDASANVKLTASTIRFLTDDVAIEDGAVEVTREGAPPAGGKFAAVWLKQDGHWRLASLREARLERTTADDLAALDWMVGHWAGKGGQASFDLTARWNAKHTFLERDLTVTHEGRVILDGRQRIGIDPADGKIKSWMHDDDGGHGEGLWTRQGDAWVVQAIGVAPDGQPTASTNVYTPDGPNAMIWKSSGGMSGGQKVPEFEIKLERVTPESK